MPKQNLDTSIESTADLHVKTSFIKQGIETILSLLKLSDFQLRFSDKMQVIDHSRLFF